MSKAIYSTKQLDLLNKANSVAKTCSIKVKELDDKYRLGEITKDEMEKEHCNIEEMLADVWLNKESDGSRVPVYFEDLEVPENLKPFFESIFIDF